jgi:hypothetical protein
MKCSPMVNDSGFPGPEKEDEIIHASSEKKYRQSGGIDPIGPGLYNIILFFLPLPVITSEMPSTDHHLRPLAFQP